MSQPIDKVPGKSRSLANLTGGSRKGVPNKTTASVKAALEAAFDKMGGPDALVTWGQDNPTEFYKLWIKMLPTEVKADLGGSFAELLAASMGMKLGGDEPG